jgi:hypothetical protein
MSTGIGRGTKAGRVAREKGDILIWSNQPGEIRKNDDVLR